MVDDLVLAKIYIKDKWSLRKIEREFGGCRKKYKTRLMRLGVKIRGQGDPLVEALKARKGKDNGKWKGGQFKTYNGYVRILSREHPRADAAGCGYPKAGSKTTTGRKTFRPCRTPSTDGCLMPNTGGKRARKATQELGEQGLSIW